VVSNFPGQVFVKEPSTACGGHSNSGDTRGGQGHLEASVFFACLRGKAHALKVPGTDE
jgi:hypothetical protein